MADSNYEDNDFERISNLQPGEGGDAEQEDGLITPDGNESGEQPKDATADELPGIHHLEHKNGQFVLVDYKNNNWNNAGNQLNVVGYSVSGGGRTSSIRTIRAFSTAQIPGISDQLIYNVHYFEVTVNETPTGIVCVGLADEEHTMKETIGVLNDCFGFAMYNNGRVLFSTEEKAQYENTFAANDVIGCGVMIAQKTKHTDCPECRQKQFALFFTKNGQLLGTPIPLPSNTPAMLYPAVSVTKDKVTANFGQEPFKFGIPPAKGLNVCSRCIVCVQIV